MRYSGALSKYRIILAGLFIVCCPIEQARSDQVDANIQISIEVTSTEANMFIRNVGRMDEHINGNLTAGGLSSPGLTYLVIRDKNGKEYRVRGVIDSIPGNESLLLPPGYFYGRSFSLDALKIFFGLDDGEYEIKAVYDNSRTPSHEESVFESEWAKVQFMP